MLTVKIKPEQVDQFKKVLAMNSEQSRLEPGCVRYDTMQDDADSCTFFISEVYKSQAAFEEHKMSKHYADWVKLDESGAMVSQSVQKCKGLFFG